MSGYRKRELDQLASDPPKTPTGPPWFGEPVVRVAPKKDEGPFFRMSPQNPGSVLLSHRVAPAVPSALKSLTSVFGMGTGVTSSV